MSVFGRLFGTQKAVDNLLDSEKGLLKQAGNWIGNMQYTEEEKAEAAHDLREWGLRQLDALTPFKVTQRVLAISASTLWIVVAINVLVSIWVGDNTKTEAFLSFATSEYIFWPVLTVFGLYFAGGVIPDNVLNRKKPTKK